jgi:hypothetical protein
MMKRGPYDQTRLAASGEDQGGSSGWLMQAIALPIRTPIVNQQTGKF